MSATSVQAIAQAVLYEGYILYPYRPALKNCQRWTFGGIYPRAYSEAQGGSDAWQLQTECLLQGTPSSRVAVSVRFLHLMDRTACRLAQPLARWSDAAEPALEPTGVLHVAGQQYHSWQEAVEREVPCPAWQLGDLAAQCRHARFEFAACRSTETIDDAAGQPAGALVRRQQPLSGTIELSAAVLDRDTWRLTLRIVNETVLADPPTTRDEALLQSFVSTHAILHVHDGQFLSLIDPPPSHQQAAQACQNVGLWPVLAGDPAQRDTLLAAPIILYDYPQVAPESPGDLFDGTEIDEILTLRIQTLTDEERQAAAAVDPQIGRLLERTASLAREQMLGLHGTLRHPSHPQPKERHA